MSPDDRVSGKPISPQSRPAAGDLPLPASSLPSLAGGGGSGGLSSLAQAARQKELRNARWTLVIVGLLTIVVNFVFMYFNLNAVNEHLRKAGLDPNNPPPQVTAALNRDYLFTGIFVAQGVALVLLGIFVYKLPVLCTVTGLVLYIGGWLASGAINPAAIWQGIIIKVIIVAALFKAVQAAFAYERELKASPVETD